MQERYNSIANTLELRLFCTNPYWLYPTLNKSYLIEAVLDFPQDGVQLHAPSQYPKMIETIIVQLL